MIGLPTTVISSTSSRSTPAAVASSAVSFARQPRTTRVSSFSEPGFIITYETRLIRSSPKRICGFISPADASTSPREEVAEVPGDRGRADVERDPVRAVVEPRPDAGDRRRRRGPRRSPASAPVAQRGFCKRRGARAWSQARPVSPHSRSSASRSRVQVARRATRARAARPRRVEAHDRVDLDRVRVRLLAHDLAVDLALGWHVDHDVAGRPCAVQPSRRPAASPRSAAYARSTAPTGGEVRPPTR